MPNKAPAYALLAGLAGLWLGNGPVSAQEPLSAIDWLSRTPAMALTNEPPVVDTAALPVVDVRPLDAPGRDAVGLLPGRTTGLPDSLWQASHSDDLVRKIHALPANLLPAMQGLLYTLLLAEANPPLDASTADKLLIARIDRLIDLGALEPAAALLERAGPTTPELFRRWFDVTLLMGQEDTACIALMAQPHLAPDYRARVFCTSRTGDWTGATTTLYSARALGLISADNDLLLARFLDPELFEGEPPLPVPTAPDPLTFRLYEAIGEALPTRLLPRQYAHADLRSTAGWKAQLEAAERLAHSGAIQPNRLLGVFTARRPAASGMIWDRVAAIQALDVALAGGDNRQVSDSLPAAWEAMKQSRLEVAFSELFAPELARARLNGPATHIAYNMTLLSSDYERAARSGARVDFARAIALGAPPDRAKGGTEKAIAAAFRSTNPPAQIKQMLADGKLGEVLLEAMATFEQGADGDNAALEDALATFRFVGLEDIARRAALQVLLLDRNG